RLLATQHVWNDFLWPLVITNTENMRTLPIGVSRMIDQEGNTQWGVVMAGAIYVILPLLIVFLWAQRHIVEGIAAGAVKGWPGAFSVDSPARTTLGGEHRVSDESSRPAQRHHRPRRLDLAER